MLEVAQNFEQVAMRFGAVFLIVPGLFLSVIGLFVWLSGLRFKAVLTVLAAAFIGLVCGFRMAGQNDILPYVIAGGIAFFARFFERIFTAILAALLMAIFTLVVLNLPEADSARDLQPFPESKIQSYAIPKNFNQTMGTVRSFAARYRFELRDTVTRMPLYKWVITVIAALAAGAAGFFFARFASAFCWATLGTTLVFLGMVILLFYKGAVPITHIARGYLFYLAAFVAMVAFGILEQLFLCQSAAKVTSKGKRPKKSETKTVSNEFDQKSWRST